MRPTHYDGRHPRCDESALSAQRLCGSARSGASSGGHLALMLALTDEYDEIEGDVKPIGANTGESVSSHVAAAMNKPDFLNVKQPKSISLSPVSFLKEYFISIFISTSHLPALVAAV